MTDENRTNTASADNGNARDGGFVRDTGQSDHRPVGVGASTNIGLSLIHI